MNLKTIAATSILAFSAASSPVHAQSQDEVIKTLLQRIDALESKVKSLESANTGTSSPKVEALNQKVRILERKNEIPEEAATEQAKTAPVLAAGANGFSIKSADGNFAAALRGVVQVDSRTFFHDSGLRGIDGFLLRRARPIVEGTLFKDFDFLFVPDFGGSSVQIFDANLNYKYSSAFQIRLGKFKTPVGLEQLQADKDILFNERALVTDLVPNRDLGIQLHGELSDGAIAYAAGLFNGVGDARNSTNLEFDGDRQAAARLFFQPFKNHGPGILSGFGFGAGGSYGSTHGTAGLPGTTGGTLPGYATDGQQQFFAYNPTTGAVTANGTHWRVSPQAYLYHGPLGFMAEYAISNQRVTRTGVAPLSSAHLENTAWQFTGSWVLTGEDASFKGVTPANAFDPRANHWGALQLVARVAQLEVDRAAFPLFANPATSARSAQSFSAGLNWYLNKNIKAGVSYSHTDFTGGGVTAAGPGLVTRHPEDALFTRVQLAF